jgi:hypothetical protein
MTSEGTVHSVVWRLAGVCVLQCWGGKRLVIGSRVDGLRSETRGRGFVFKTRGRFVFVRHVVGFVFIRHVVGFVFVRHVVGFVFVRHVVRFVFVHKTHGRVCVCP